MTRRSSIGVPPTLLILWLLLTGCSARFVLEEVYASEGREVVVSLRRSLEDGEPVPRNYRHPVVISDVRMAHILAHLRYEESEGGQLPAIRTRHVYPLAEGLVQALSKATPNDEVIAHAIAVERKFGIFTSELVTAFSVAFEDGFMNIDFYEVNAVIDRNEKKIDNEKYKFPPKLPEMSPGFKLVAAQTRLARGTRGLAVDWRDPLYGKALRLSERRSNRRRTILMETEEPSQTPDVTAPAAPIMTPAMRDAQLRALDRLDAARRSGLITEIEFHRRRRLIMDGRLEEAGYAQP